MPRFFTNVLDEDDLKITGDDARHIGRSLRMRIGEAVTLCCCGIDYNCIISSISDESVRLELVEALPCASEPNVRITLFQAVPKADKLEFIVQKAVELGVSRIVPFVSRRCVSKPSEADFSKKLTRLQKISREASKQSGRGIIPQIMPVMTLKQAASEMKKLDLCMILYEEGGRKFSEVDFLGKQNIGVVIGSEGGFDKEEVDLAQESGALPVWLGKRILRCETAPVTALSIIMFLTKNM